MRSRRRLARVWRYAAQARPVRELALESMIRGVMTLTLAVLPALFASCGRVHAADVTAQDADGVAVESAHGAALEAH